MIRALSLLPDAVASKPRASGDDPALLKEYSGTDR